MQRICAINPIEPAWLSGVAPAGFDCPIDFVYRSVGDTTWNTDLAATLVLTARSTETSTTYLVPATDVVNGKARTVVPGGDLSDPNGYRMTLVGTYLGARTVLASGVLKITDEGIPAIPAVDVIDTVDLTLTYGQPATINITLWEDVEDGTPYDLTAEGTTISATIYTEEGGTTLAPFSVTPLASNKVQLSLTIDEVNALPASCWWSLTASVAFGSATLCKGTITITGTP